MGLQQTLRDRLAPAALVGRREARLAAAYARRRDAVNRSCPPPATTPERRPGQLVATQPRPFGVLLTFTTASLEIRALTRDLLLFGWDDALSQPSHAVTLWTRDRPQVAHGETPDGGYRMDTGALAVIVSAEGAITVLDGAGSVRRRDDPPVWNGVGWTVRTRLEPDAVVQGLGGRASSGDLRGGSYRLWNTDPGGAWSSESDPLYVSTPAYVVLTEAGASHCFVDNTYDGTVAIGTDRDPEAVVTRLSDGPLRYSVSIGTLATVLNRFTELTGRPALPPRWALGYHHAKWGYRTAGDIRSVWRGFLDRGLPLSAVHLDIDHMDRNRDFSLDIDRYGEMPALAAEMAATNVHTVAIVDAGVPRAEDDPVYASGEAIGAWVRGPDGAVVEGAAWPGRAVFPDYTREDVRSWWGRQYRQLTAHGAAGVWHDMNEPSVFAAWGDPTLPLCARHAMDGRGGDHRQAHNVYGLLMNQAGYEGLKRHQPDRRPFLFSRSGWAGQQRYGGHWSGDIRTDWEGLQLSLSYTVGLGASGVPFSGPDSGGFSSDPDPELYARWFQLASWLPFFRTHGSINTRPREPWVWPEAVQDALRVALQWRYRLLPYWYTLAREAHETGAPYVRPLAWREPALRAVNDEFLLGDQILVAPVLKPGVTLRQVTLPKGIWYDAASGSRIDGGRTITVSAPLQRTPWFIRAGAVVPTEVEGTLVLLATPPVKNRKSPGGSLWVDNGDGWDGGRRERYGVAMSPEGEVHVSREVVTEGPFPWRAVSAAALGAKPGTRVRLV